MLDNTITLSVDEDNSGSGFQDTVFTRQEEYLNRSLYKGPAHTMSRRDTLGFYRTQPKRSGNDLGTAKVDSKFTQDIEVDGADPSTSMVKPLIGAVNLSIPVGATDAQLLVLRQRIIALLDHAIVTRHHSGLEI
jgi:hypothetical protein